MKMISCKVLVLCTMATLIAVAFHRTDGELRMLMVDNSIDKIIMMLSEINTCVPVALYIQHNTFASNKI